jgi:uncharacterized protein
MHVAIIGSGISGMAAAWRLHKQHEITLFEANTAIGGHTATVEVETLGKTWAIDTGFIVYNDWTYPQFSRLLREIGVASQDSNMSFSLSCERSGLEYNGTSLNTLFAQRRNLLNVPFLRMLAEILRFNGLAPRLLNTSEDNLTLGAYLHRQNYSERFIHNYIVPMGRAIWSATEAALLAFPAKFFIDFFQRHGFLNINNRPQWRTISGGSRVYAEKLTAPFKERIRLLTPVHKIARTAQGIQLYLAQGLMERYDAVVLACHADQALRLLADASPAESRILGAFPYQKNQVSLHTDSGVLPRSRLARAAWNYHRLRDAQQPLALTYDMNTLMTIDAPMRFLVSLNLQQKIDSKKVLREFTYEHPVYTPSAVQAQGAYQQISGISSERPGTFYCGAYWGYGFHEDGLVSGYRAAAQVEEYANQQAAPEARYA